MYFLGESVLIGISDPWHSAIKKITLNKYKKYAMKIECEDQFESILVI